MKALVSLHWSAVNDIKDHIGKEAFDELFSDCGLMCQGQRDYNVDGRAGVVNIIDDKQIRVVGLANYYGE